MKKHAIKKPKQRTNHKHSKKVKHPERIFQQELVVKLEEVIKGDVEWTHFPAGGGGLVRGVFLKKMGLKRGWPDLIFLRDGTLYCLELKAENGKLSEQQQYRQNRLKGCGALVDTAWDIAGALSTLKEWGLIKERKASA